LSSQLSLHSLSFYPTLLIISDYCPEKIYGRSLQLFAQSHFFFSFADEFPSFNQFSVFARGAETEHGTSKEGLVGRQK
jgi:hypothetical protein